MPNYPPQLQDMEQDVLSRLGETDDSPVGEFRPGDGNAPIISTKETIRQYLNEACAELARTCYPISDSGSYPMPVGTAIIPYTAFVCASGHTLWSARRVIWNGIELEYYRRSAFEFWYPTAETDPAGTPVLWYRTGDGIGLYPVPSSAHTATAYGLVIPKQLVEDTDVATWFQPDVLKLPVLQTASRLAERNNQNPDIISRAQEWDADFEAGRKTMLDQLWANDPQLAAFHYGAPGGA